MAHLRPLPCLALAFALLLPLAAATVPAGVSRSLLQESVPPVGDPENPTLSCQPAPPNSVDLPPNAVPVFTLEVTSGTRNFTCGLAGEIGLSQAVANLTGDYEGVVFYNPTGIAIFDLWNATTGQPAGAVWLETRRPAPTSAPAPDGVSLPLARWAIMRVTGSIPVVGYATRTETEGGEAPQPCEPARALLAVPYLATYTFYSCR